ncbi:MAG TPA: gamma carbonic anhydrase family protein, partial [Casimicrobium huifangae]|nr:gamma carbonic anhydrase family protein [Casimicrobium huifangae]
MAIYELDGVKPQIHETAWIAESAEVIGNVHIGA